MSSKLAAQMQLMKTRRLWGHTQATVPMRVVRVTFPDSPEFSHQPPLLDLALKGAEQLLS